MHPRRVWLLLGLLGTCGCGASVSPTVRAEYHALRIPVAQCRGPGPERVSPEEARRDLRLLAHLFRRGYAGYDLAGGDARFDAARDAAERGVPESPVPVSDFVDQIIEAYRFVDDNHVGFTEVRGPGQRRFRSTSGHDLAHVGALRFVDRGEGPRTDEGATLLRCGERSADALLRPILGEDPAEATYAIVLLSRARETSIACTFQDASGETIDQSVALEVMNLAEGGGPAYERLEAPWPWHRLRTLFPDHAAALDRFVASGTGMRDEDVVVIDLRHAGGGSDRYLLRWFQDLTRASFDYWTSETLTSEVTLQGALSFFRCILAGQSGDAGGQTWLTERVARAERDLDRAMAQRGLFMDRRAEAVVLEGHAERPFAGRLILVVDRGCSSACETSVLLARQLAGAVVVGENTAGVMRVGEIRSYRLPGSRVFVTLGTRMHREAGAGTFREGAGFMPDVWLAPTNADAQVRRLAACLGDATCRERFDAARRIDRGTE